MGGGGKEKEVVGGARNGSGKEEEGSRMPILDLHPLIRRSNRTKIPRDPTRATAGCSSATNTGQELV